MTGAGDRDEARRLRTAYDRLGLDGPLPPARFASPGDAFILDERQRHTLAVLRRAFPQGLHRQRILDLGAGTGLDVIELLGYGADAHRTVGVDLLLDRLRIAAERLRGSPLVQANGVRLPFPNGTFALALQHTVFSSMLDATVRRTAAAELVRVLAPGGLLLWYDLRVDNPRNPAVRGISERELHALFPGTEIKLRRITLIPPLARRLVPVSPTLASLLAAFPLLRTHLFGEIRIR